MKLQFWLFVLYDVIFIDPYKELHIYLNKRQIKIHYATITVAAAEAVFREASSGVDNSSAENDERTDKEPANNLKTNIN